ncbi:TPA: hypothetical protein OW435_001428 [Pseudomonas aeruginosa]|nr:hypothetical protein [Pseudomonas aeruginosa]HCW0594710.1 hypothetical protein [Pseudomonas aeruginosa]
MQLRAAVSGLLLALLAGQTVAASFDCSKASSFPETEICRDGYLSGLDEWLARSYKTALEVNPGQSDAVRQSQREWLATRNACTDQQCLDSTIGARIQALDQYVTAEKGKAASALAHAQLNKHQEAEAIRQRQTAERLGTEEAARQAQIENQRQLAIIELQQRGQAAQALETQRAGEHQQVPAQIPQYQPPQKVAPASSATSSSPSYRSPEKTLWQQFKSSPAWKYLLLAGGTSDSLGDVETPSGANNHLQRLHGCRDYEPLAGCRRGTGLLDELARAASSTRNGGRRHGFHACIDVRGVCVGANQSGMDEHQLVAHRQDDSGVSILCSNRRTGGIAILKHQVQRGVPGESECKEPTGEERNDGHDLRAHYCLHLPFGLAVPTARVHLCF